MVFLHWWREVERGFRRRRRNGSGREMKRRVARWWKSGGGGEDCECREKRFSVEIVSWLFHFTLSQSRVSDFNLISLVSLLCCV